MLCVSMMMMVCVCVCTCVYVHVCVCEGGFFGARLVASIPSDPPVSTRHSAEFTGACSHP